MTASNIHPPIAVDQQHPLRLALSKSFRVAFTVTVALGTLVGTGLVLCLLKASRRAGTASTSGSSPK